MQHLFVLDPESGHLSGLYQETIPLRQLGHVEMQRASTVEFNSRTQRWEVRLASEPERVAFSHPSRETCLTWEHEHFNDLNTDIST